jgi:hypothetical protein
VHLAWHSLTTNAPQTTAACNSKKCHRLLRWPHSNQMQTAPQAAHLCGNHHAVLHGQLHQQDCIAQQPGFIVVERKNMRHCSWCMISNAHPRSAHHCWCLSTGRVPASCLSVVHDAARKDTTNDDMRDTASSAHRDNCATPAAAFTTLKRAQVPCWPLLPCARHGYSTPVPLVLCQADGKQHHHIATVTSQDQPSCPVHGNRAPVRFTYHNPPCLFATPAAVMWLQQQEQ